MSSALLATESLRTANLKPKDSALKKLQITNIPEGAQLFDEFSQIPTNLLHASCLRACYARKHAHNLELNNYASLQGLWGQVPVLALFGDHLQLPPVPQSNSLFSCSTSDGNHSNEHMAGCSIFSSIPDVFQFRTARRFKDPDLIAILEAMRTPNGKKITETQWTKILQTEINTEDPAFDSNELLEHTFDWFHSAYTWNFVSMAMALRAQHGARKEQKQLLYIPSVDQPKKFCTEALYKEMLEEFNLRKTNKIPGVALIYIGMKVRFTTSIQPPLVVQDTTGTVVALELAAADAKRISKIDADIVLDTLPKAVYIQIDDCTEVFLPPKANCNMQGLFALKPVSRTWDFKSEETPNFSTKVSRTGFPLAPATVCPLYSMQGTTAEGLVMHWQLPKRLSTEVRWLIVYVALSRIRELSTLKSIGLTQSIRDLIENGPPQSLLQSFDKYFGQKVERTTEKAKRYRAELGWPTSF